MAGDGADFTATWGLVRVAANAFAGTAGVFAGTVRAAGVLADAVLADAVFEDPVLEDPVLEAAVFGAGVLTGFAPAPAASFDPVPGAPTGFGVAAGFLEVVAGAVFRAAVFGEAGLAADFEGAGFGLDAGPATGFFVTDTAGFFTGAALVVAAPVAGFFGAAVVAPSIRTGSPTASRRSSIPTR